GGIRSDDAARSRPIVDNERLAQRSLQIRGDQPRHDVIETARGKGDDQADRAVGIGLGMSAGDERDRKQSDNTELGSARLMHCPTLSELPATLIDELQCASRIASSRHQAASFFISPRMASPIWDVVTTVAPSDFMSAVRRPCARAAEIAASIWS